MEFTALTTIYHGMNLWLVHLDGIIVLRNTEMLASVGCNVDTAQIELIMLLPSIWDIQQQYKFQKILHAECC
ncbi:hypothetical protein T09_12540 [Trichinella sp. T9]|nr:hypothetical protein T09_12540 [Trichinella sp. T9]